MKGQILSRHKNKRPLKKTILLICEGEKTEPSYFKHFKPSLRGILKIEILNTSATDAEKLSKFAVKQQERLGLSHKDGDRTWVIFDCDQNTQLQLDKTNSMATKAKINLAFSNPCFEFWYLLHFELYSQQLSASEVLARLKQFLPRYKKDSDVYNELKERMVDAVKRAQTLKNQCDEKGLKPLSVAANPSTSVGFLVDYLIKQV